MLPLDTSVPDFAMPDSAGTVVRYREFLEKNRIVLVAIPNLASAQATAYLEQARAHQAEYEERDTVLVMVVPAASPLAKTSSAQSLYVLHDPTGATLAALGAASDTPVSYLIGKDRGIKRRSAGFLAARELFDAIDSMPMRRQEMRERR